MKVLKFGGSSVGSAEGLSQVKKVVGACTEDAIVVVSALGGITDMLLQTARTAAAGDDGYAASLAEMVARHYGLADTVVLKENLPSVREQIGRLLDELSNIFKGVYLIKDLSPKTTDAIVSYGERLSSVIVCGALPGAVRYDARRVRQDEALFRAAYRRLRIDRGTDPRDVPADAAHGGRARLHRERSGEPGTLRTSAEEVRTIRRRFSPRPSMPRCSKSGPTSTVS